MFTVRSGRAQAPTYDHDHTPTECSFCQPQTEKTSRAASSDSSYSISEEKIRKAESLDATSSSDSGKLTPEEQQQVEELKKRDQEVRLHEQAHLAAAGAYAKGGPTFTYQRGPDGQMYAIGGEVPIDAGPVADDPQATIRKAEAIQRAALAPAEPSGPDRKVAAQATAMATKARQELVQQSQETTNTDKKFASYQPNFLNSGTSFPSPPLSSSESSSSPLPFHNRRYSQQKQEDVRSLAGTLLDIFA